MPTVIDPHAVHALADALGFALAPAATATLTAYLSLLMQWNRAMNLVGAATWQEAMRTLIVDSLHLAPFLDALPLVQHHAEAASADAEAAFPLCWDLGAGAGLPGIPLRAVWQRGTYWMIEAREKRAMFLSTVLARHPLPRTHVFRGRAEHFFAPTSHSPLQADIILSRAFMPWRALLAFIEPVLAPDGVVVCLARTPIALAELATLPPSIGAWTLHAEYNYSVGADARLLCALTRSRADTL